MIFVMCGLCVFDCLFYFVVKFWLPMIISQVIYFF